MTSTRPLVSLTLAALCAGLPAQLNWKSSLDQALAAAAKEQQVLLVAVLIPGERDSEALLSTYRDAGIRKLTRSCVCLRIDIATERGDEDRLAVLERFLDAPPREPFLAPHHVIVKLEPPESGAPESGAPESGASRSTVTGYQAP